MFAVSQAGLGHNVRGAERGVVWGAWGMWGAWGAIATNGSLFALLPYMQHAPAQLWTPVCGSPSSAAPSSSPLCCRLSHRIPARWLIGPGLLLVGHARN